MQFHSHIRRYKMLGEIKQLDQVHNWARFKTAIYGGPFSFEHLVNPVIVLGTLIKSKYYMFELPMYTLIIQIILYAISDFYTYSDMLTNPIFSDDIYNIVPTKLFKMIEDNVETIFLLWKASFLQLSLNNHHIISCCKMGDLVFFFNFSK